MNLPTANFHRTHLRVVACIPPTTLYCSDMVILRFDTGDEERRALGWLAGRFSFKTWDNGDLMVHEAVLPYLAREGISFRVQGQATYEHFRPAIRDSAPA